MPILMTAVVPGLDVTGYDQVIGHVGPNLQTAPGFRAHTAYDSDGGWTVVEVWESEADWRTWFDANVRDHLPAETKVAVTEAHNVLCPEVR